MSETAISVKNLSKKYRLFQSPRDRVKEALHPFRKRYHQEFWALKNVSFEVRRGQTVGILGRNGSGKSTLLQIIAGVMPPTEGEVSVRGSVSALLELGAGFNPEFTGRENVVLQAQAAGLPREEIEKALPGIEAFADIGQFFDQPVKTYSSGMFVRVAFAGAVHVDPDILIIDEALAVGDARFQSKCFARIQKFQEQGKTIILVTHDVNSVLQHCDRAIFIENGCLMEDGIPKDVVNIYLDFILTGTLKSNKPSGIPEQDTGNPGIKAGMPPSKGSGDVQNELHLFFSARHDADWCPQNATYNKEEYRLGDGRASIVDYRVTVGDQTDPPFIEHGSIIDVYLKGYFFDTIDSPMFGFAIKTVDGVMVNGSNTRYSKLDLPPIQRGDVVVFKFTLQMNLHPGDYFLDLGIAEMLAEQDKLLDVRYSLIHLNVIKGDKNWFDGMVNLELGSELVSQIKDPTKKHIHETSPIRTNNK